MLRRTFVRALLVSTAVICSPSGAGEAIQLRSETGVLLVPVLINGRITLNFTLDSGASDVSIPADVVSTLIRTDTIGSADLLPSARYRLADGSVQEQIRFRIRSLRVGTIELHDVVGSVAPLQGPLLLGQSFLSRFRFWSVDNQRHLLLLDQAPSQSEVAESQSPSPMPTHAPATNVGRFEAARERCLRTAGPADSRLCDELTEEDVIQSEARASRSGDITSPPAAATLASTSAPQTVDHLAGPVTPERYAAARARCQAVAGPADDRLCDQLTEADVIQSEARFGEAGAGSAYMTTTNPQRLTGPVSSERYAAAQARCRAAAGPADARLCDTLTPEDVLRSEAAASYR